MDGDGWDNPDASTLDLIAQIERQGMQQQRQVISQQTGPAAASTTSTLPRFEVLQARKFHGIGKSFLKRPIGQENRASQAGLGGYANTTNKAERSAPAPAQPQSSERSHYAPAHGTGGEAAANGVSMHAPTSSAHRQAAVPKQSSSAAFGEAESRQAPYQAAEPVQAKRLLLSASVKIGPACTVDFDLPYNETLRNLTRELGCLSWIPKSRVWRTDAHNYERVRQALYSMPSLDIRLDDLHDVPRSVLQLTARREDESERYSNIPASLESSLMHFQRDGVRFALQRGSRVLIGDEMGLGKTVQAIALLAAHTDRWPALIIAPSSLREQWADALHQWLGVTERRMLIVNTGKDADVARHCFPQGGGASRDFLIISYNFVSKMQNTLREADFQVVVVDESHCIKDAKALRTKDTLPVVQKARCAILLSGTPMISRPKEIMTQLAALVPEAKLKLQNFGERYCLSVNPRFGKYEGCCNQEELNRLLISTVMVRRLKKDVLDQLPPKRRQQVFLTLDRAEKDRIDRQSAAMDAARSLVNEAESHDMMSSCMRQEQRKLVMDLYRLTAEVKVKVVQQYVTELLEQNQKFLIFCHHKIMNDGIAEILNKKKVEHICIDGSVRPDKRQGLVQRFQADHRVKVALLSIKAAGVGLTLTAASMVVFAELAWSPSEIFQAEDRAHRIGQPSSVNVYFLHVKQSVDDIMWSLIQSKLHTVGQTINGCKDTFDMMASTEQRQRNQASLRGFLTLAEDTGAGPSVEAGQSAPSLKSTLQVQKVPHKQTGMAAYCKPPARD